MNLEIEVGLSFEMCCRNVLDLRISMGGAWTKRKAMEVQFGIKHIIIPGNHETMRFSMIENGIRYPLKQNR